METLFQQLIDALVREDIRNIVIILGHAVPDDINAPYSKDDGRTALHIAAALGNVVYVQLLLWVSKLFAISVEYFVMWLCLVQLSLSCFLPPFSFRPLQC